MVPLNETRYIAEPPPLPEKKAPRKRKATSPVRVQEVIIDLGSEDDGAFFWTRIARSSGRLVKEGQECCVDEGNPCSFLLACRRDVELYIENSSFIFAAAKPTT
uniref:Uncharacterized protein n=1 Tax=Parascaris equorum TaxID=6256 RepID=A0A914S2E6_PAREQ